MLVLETELGSLEEQSVLVLSHFQIFMFCLSSFPHVGIFCLYMCFVYRLHLKPSVLRGQKWSLYTLICT